jgi:hypothetical protein
MAKYRKKSSIVDAVQWFKDGDHPDVTANSAGDSQYLYDDWGYFEVDPGDWIVTYEDGTVVCCDPETFAQFFEPIKNAVDKAEDEQKYIDWYHRRQTMDTNSEWKKWPDEKPTEMEYYWIIMDRLPYYPFLYGVEFWDGKEWPRHVVGLLYFKRVESGYYIGELLDKDKDNDKDNDDIKKSFEVITDWIVKHINHHKGLAESENGAPAVDGWYKWPEIKPTKEQIEKNGGRFCMYFESNAFVAVVDYVNDHFDFNCITNKPTHWCELPELPRGVK